MAPVQSKAEQDDAAKAKKDALVKASLIHCFQSVAQHVMLVQSEPMLLKEICNGDMAEAAKLLANTSGLVGILGLLVNQVGGKMSDVHGRKMFLMMGPIGNMIFGSLVYANPTNKRIVLICRVLRMIMTTFSNTVMIGSSYGDILPPEEHKAAGVKLSAIVGASVVLTPFIEAAVLARTKNPRYSYLVLALLSAVQAVSSGLTFPETLEVAKRAKQATGNLLATINPFGFVNLYTRGSRALSGLTTISTFQLLLDGKNMSDFTEIWKREHLGFTVEQSRNFIVLYGTLVVVSSAVFGEKLLKAMTARQYTSFTNILNAIAFSMRGTTKTWLFLLAVLPMLPGVNGASTRAIATRCTELAKKEGFGMGEFSAWTNNMRALASAIQPVLIGNYYAWCIRKGVFPGSVYWFLGFFGAIVPEILMKFMTDRELGDEAEKSKVA